MVLLKVVFSVNIYVVHHHIQNCTLDKLSLLKCTVSFIQSVIILKFRLNFPKFNVVLHKTKTVFSIAVMFYKKIIFCGHPEF